MSASKPQLKAVTRAVRKVDKSLDLKFSGGEVVGRKYTEKAYLVLVLECGHRKRSRFSDPAPKRATCKECK